MPTAPIAPSTVLALLYCACLLGALLLVSTFLRSQLAILRKLFIPAPLLAGLLGLALGPYGLQLIPSAVVESWAALPAPLIAIVFAPMLIGMAIPNPKKVMHLIGPQLCFAYGAGFLQIGLPLLLCATVLSPAFGVPPLFGSLVEMGWAGGHGTAAGMAPVLAQLGFADGGSLALVSATIGLLIGIFVGLVLINLAARRGIIAPLASKGDPLAGDILPRDQQASGAKMTLKGDAIESMAFHFSLICLAILIGWLMLQGIRPIVSGMPLFPMAMLGGLVLQVFIARSAFAPAVDTGSLQRLQGLALDFLIPAAVASIKLPVVLAYAAPLLLMSAVAAIALVAYFFIFGPRFFARDWFAHAIVNFGTMTGVTAVGLMLLRAVDPGLDSEAAKSYALRTPFFSPILGGGLLTSILPALIVNHGALRMGGFSLLAFFVVLLLARLGGFWRTEPAEDER